MRARAAAMALAALLAAACDVPHEYETREFTAPLAASPPDGAARIGAAGPVRVEVKFTAGGIHLHAADPDRFYRASIESCRIHTEASADLSPAADGGSPRLVIRLAGRPGVFAGFGGERNTMDLAITPTLPAALDLDLGEGESVLDLRDLRVSRLRVTGGAGDTRIVFGSPNPVEAEEMSVKGTIGDVSIDMAGNANARSFIVQGGVGTLELDLSGRWDRDASIRIEPSVGDVVLKMPGRGIGVRMVVGSPWGEELSAPGLARRDGAFYSDGYEGAARRLDVRVEAGIGRLLILEESG